ncbi:MAG: hypothetical protein Q4A04_08415 [Eubacteriales bacterium]|nr:hypothetical protein [Eubacteriales bacterium]
MEFLAVFFLAIVVEGIVEHIKQGFPVIADKTWAILLITWLIGIGGCLVFGIDVFDLLKIRAKVPFAGEIITGMLIARGSNYMYDLIGKFTDGGINGRRS